MKAINARIPRVLPHGARLEVCDNSGAKELKVISIKNLQTTRGRYPAAKIGDLILASVTKGKPDIKKNVVMAVVVRQKKEYLRPDGTRLKFQDNAAVVVKDVKGNPKGTIFKGPIAKEACERWPAVAKLSRIVV